MRQHRVYLDMALAHHREVALDERAFHYLVKVLRLKNGTQIQVFNGQGGSYHAELQLSGKRSANLLLGEHHPEDHQSPLDTELWQGVSKPEHMDYALQKATELGVHCITPIVTGRTQAFHAKHAEKKHEHWKGVIINACEQCGRNRLPLLKPMTSLNDALEQRDKERRYAMLDLNGEQSFAQWNPEGQAMTWVIGPEGGLSDEEIAQIKALGIAAIRMGNRVLRTETAAAAVLSLAQGLWGDWAN